MRNNDIFLLEKAYKQINERQNKLQKAVYLFESGRNQEFVEFIQNEWTQEDLDYLEEMNRRGFLGKLGRGLAGAAIGAAGLLGGTAPEAKADFKSNIAAYQQASKALDNISQSDLSWIDNWPVKYQIEDKTLKEMDEYGLLFGFKRAINDSIVKTNNEIKEHSQQLQSAKGPGSSSDYGRQLIQRLQNRIDEKQQIIEKLQKAADSAKTAQNANDVKNIIKQTGNDETLMSNFTGIAKMFLTKIAGDKLNSGMRDDLGSGIR